MGYFSRTIKRRFFYDADSDTLAFARELRKNMTAAEKELWMCLRNKGFCGYTFRRQHAIKFYIADFYCHQLKLVIEVDGSVHEDAEVKEHDQNRDAELRNLGLMVIRFTNREVTEDMEYVLQTISRVVEVIQGLNHPPPLDPLPHGGGG